MALVFISIPPPFPVQWQMQAGEFTSVIGGRYQVDTLGGASTIHLPGIPEIGNEVLIEDMKGGFGTNGAVIKYAAHPLNGAASDFIASTNWQKLRCVYTGTDYGWSIK